MVRHVSCCPSRVERNHLLLLVLVVVHLCVLGQLSVCSRRGRDLALASGSCDPVGRVVDVLAGLGVAADPVVTEAGADDGEDGQGRGAGDNGWNEKDVKGCKKVRQAPSKAILVNQMSLILSCSSWCLEIPGLLEAFLGIWWTPLRLLGSSISLLALGSGNRRRNNVDFGVRTKNGRARND